MAGTAPDCGDARHDALKDSPAWKALPHRFFSCLSLPGSRVRIVTCPDCGINLTKEEPRA